MMEEAAQLEDNLIYELKSVIVHMGTPYGGHYEAFIRDNMNEKPWNPKPYEAEVPKIFEGDEDLLLNWFEMNDTSVTPVNGLVL